MRLRSKRMTTILTVAAVVVPGGAVAWAAYTATTGNSGNRIEAGSVKLTDNDSSSALLSLSSAMPGTGDSDSGCIKVTYEGSLTSDVRLYGTTTGSGSTSTST